MNFTVQITPDISQSTQLRVAPDSYVTFELGMTAGYAVRLEWTYPPAEATFDRSKFHPCPFGVRTLVDQPGPYAFRVITSENGRALVSGVVVVEPRLPHGLHSDQICAQTVLTKCLGPIDEWRDRLLVAVDAGYNAIHFTPVQTLGPSDSAYSLASQDELPDDQYPTCADQRERWHQLETVLGSLQSEFNLLLIQDCVWNHTAPETTWVRDHPEATYNLRDCPWLQSAYDVDAAISHFSSSLAARGVIIDSEHSMEQALRELHDTRLCALNLWEYDMVDNAELERALTEIANASSSSPSSSSSSSSSSSTTTTTATNISTNSTSSSLLDLPLIENVKHGRGTAQVNCKAALALGLDATRLRARIDEHNRDAHERAQHLCTQIIDNVRHRVRYERCEEGGPRYGAVTASHPLTTPYFEVLDQTRPELIMAHNGWMWNADPRDDFASETSSAYLTRDVIAWSDCVKLRYGTCPADNPWLWQHMREYTERTARLFDGIRVDNAHSTPLAVASYMLDAARAVSHGRVYTIAELFTGSEELDNVYANQLGLSALIREAMAAHSPAELGRVAFRHGGREPVGQMPRRGQLVGARQLPPALFMDATHDNPLPVQRRSLADMLATAALVSGTRTAIGSTRGYDELVTTNADVVTERRRYTGRRSSEQDVGMSRVRRELNQLHVHLEANHYCEQFVDQCAEDTCAIVRTCPAEHSSYVFIVRSAFDGHHASEPLRDGVSLFFERSTVAEIVLEARLTSTNAQPAVSASGDFIRGLPSDAYSLWSQTRCAPEDSRLVYVEQAATHSDKGVVGTRVHLSGRLLPGDVCVLRVEGDAEVKRTLVRLHKAPFPSETLCSDVIQHLTELDLSDALYRCESEELDCGSTGYSIPGYGALVLHGFAHLDWILRTQVRSDLGHAVCQHLRDGDWLMEWCARRLCETEMASEALRDLGGALLDHLSLIRLLPRPLVPAFVAECIYGVTVALERRAVALMPRVAKLSKGVDDARFVRQLALTSYQMYGRIPSGRMLDVSSERHEAYGHDDDVDDDGGSLAAGLPHFATGYMRCWGRDTFLSVPGLFLATGRFDVARRLLLRFASVCRHGLIPNLLAGGRRPRYNARDATWFFLECLQRYCRLAPEHLAILEAPVQRRFPFDSQTEHEAHYGTEGVATDVWWTLRDVVQHILQAHTRGIAFREWNAGRAIDAHMHDEGFDVSARVDLCTGFVHGGNQHNCGTWMDKMGESERAGTRGVPATPRDGAAIEIVGLCKSAVRWMSQLVAEGMWPWQGVQVMKQEGESLWTYAEWDTILQQSFDEWFYVPRTSDEDAAHHCRSDLVHRRGVYRDTVGATHTWCDYQLRPNQCIAMVVAPELFARERVCGALTIVARLLHSEQGMRTLDPDDWNYRPHYDNARDDDDRATARGFNYHQGPEWLWPTGFFLRALAMHGHERADELLAATRRDMGRALDASPWQGLVELTNENGSFCRDSCATQAWSMSCMLEAVLKQ